jgi:ATP/ADP translocase
MGGNMSNSFSWFLFCCVPILMMLGGWAFFLMRASEQQAEAEESQAASA